MINLEDEVGYLEGIAENYSKATADYLTAQKEMENFERHIRVFGANSLLNQSNAQKMQVEFDRLISLDSNNAMEYSKLKAKLDKAEVKYEQAKIDWNAAVQKVNLIVALS